MENKLSFLRVFSFLNISLITFFIILIVSCDAIYKADHKKISKRDSLLYSTIREHPDILKAIGIEDSMVHLDNLKSELILKKSISDELSTLELYDVKVCGGCWPVKIIYFSGCGYDYSFPYIDNWYYSKISDETELKNKLTFEKSLNKLSNGIKQNCSDSEIDKPEFIRGIIKTLMQEFLDSELLFAKDTNYILDYYSKLA